MKTIEQKIAQKFVILAYKRYRMNRRLVSKCPKVGEYWSQMNESWNHLQIAKELYYNL